MVSNYCFTSGLVKIWSIESVPKLEKSQLWKLRALKKIKKKKTL